jgi:hypothetical protein
MVCCLPKKWQIHPPGDAPAKAVEENQTARFRVLTNVFFMSAGHNYAPLFVFQEEIHFP